MDSNGKPLVGWLLYLYTANTSTPVNSYQDTALSVLNTSPIVADASGMIGQFWLADGSYRVRATSNDGSIILFDLPSVQAIGPSTGIAPSGGVDPAAIFQTGDVMWLDFQGTRTGWVRDNGRTIGSASSGASERANPDCQNLFQYIWNNFSNTQCPVIGGRGASALTDWTANKAITMPDRRGYGIVGLDDMGNSSANRLDGNAIPFILGTNGTTAGNVLGEYVHLLTQLEMPSVNFAISGITLNDPGHFHSFAQNLAVSGNAAAGGSGGNASNGVSLSQTQSKATGITVSSQGAAASGGSDDPHNIFQPCVTGTFFRKL